MVKHTVTRVVMPENGEFLTPLVGRAMPRHVSEVATEVAISDSSLWLQTGANPLPAVNRVDALTAGPEQGLEFAFGA